MSRDIRTAVDPNSDDEVVGDEDDFIRESTSELGEQHDSVKKAFQEYLENAKTIKKECYKNYVYDHHQNWSRHASDGTNFLHFLANQEKSCRQWLVVWAVTKAPALMGDLDREQRSPLTIAIHKNNALFMWAIFKNIHSRKLSTIREALKKECQPENDNNCETVLQAAVSGKIGEDYVLKIINLVPDEMFSVVDSKGRTPLHLAVENLKTNDAQVCIIKSLIDKGLDALKIRSDMHGKKFSVYQYHDKICKARREEDLGANEEEGIKSPPVPVPVMGDFQAPRHEPTEIGDSSRGGCRNLPEDSRSYHFSDISSPSIRPIRSPTLINGVMRTVSSQPMSSQAVQARSCMVESNQESNRREAERQSIQDEIRALLKMESLRIMKPLEAMECLCTTGQNDKQFWFDYGQWANEKVKASSFREQFHHLEFDEVLQYVAFPRIKLDRPGDEHNGYHGHHAGRRDMEFFFGWLKEKGVKRILRVEVDDMESPCHTDEAIEKALEGLHVEVLNWKRLDLDPATVQRIGSDLREVHLYWSGGNNVLRSWSGINWGLCMTQSLKKINLTQVQGLELKARTQQNLNDFRERLMESFEKYPMHTESAPDSMNRRAPELDIVPSACFGEQHRCSRHSRTHSTRSHTSNLSVDSHKWIDCMENFANSFRQIPELTQEQPDTSLDPVKIALIDDGVDTAHFDLRGVNNRYLHGMSFDDGEAGPGRVSPYWNSVSGHGTLMARLIRRICPSAIIYVIKVRTMQTVNSSKIQIETDSTIKAINHAIDIGAHIISMSWTIKSPERVREKEALDSAIGKAGNKPMLMFCAASDSGHFEDSTYPHASNPNLTFRIGAAKATGSTADFVGDDGISFAFPGKDVVLRDTSSDLDDDHDLENSPSHTGSSIATALAAGLAATVYECVRLSVIHTKSHQTEGYDMIDSTVLTDICKRPRMMKCFQSIGVNTRSGKPYVEVWNRFDEPGKKIDKFDGEPDEQLRIVTGLARLLLEMT